MTLLDALASALSPDHFDIGDRWFRATLIVAGTLGVASLLVAAVTNANSTYVLSAVICAISFLLIGTIAAPLTPARKEANRIAAEHRLIQTHERFEEARFRGHSEERAILASVFEPGIAAHMAVIARFAAQGELARVEDALAQLSGMMSSRPQVPRPDRRRMRALDALRQHGSSAPQGYATPEQIRRHEQKHLTLKAAAVEEFRLDPALRFRHAVALYTAHATDPAWWQDASGSPRATQLGDRRRAHLENARKEFAAALAYGYARELAWTGWGLTWVDDDPELALGAMVIAQMIAAQRERGALTGASSSRTFGPGSAWVRERIDILEARAHVMAAETKGMAVQPGLQRLAGQELPEANPLPVRAR